MARSFEWDPEKAKSNLQTQKVSFQEAETVFDDPYHATVFDSEHSGSEDRWVTIGLSKQNRLIRVSHTDRGEVIRIIGAREPTGRETEAYEEGE